MHGSTNATDYPAFTCLPMRCGVQHITRLQPLRSMADVVALSKLLDGATAAEPGRWSLGELDNAVACLRSCRSGPSVHCRSTVVHSSFEFQAGVTTEETGRWSLLGGLNNQSAVSPRGSAGQRWPAPLPSLRLVPLQKQQVIGRWAGSTTQSHV